MQRDVKQAQMLVEDYEDAIAELEEEDRRAINVWLRAVEAAVANRKFISFNHLRAGFGRSSAIELLHLRLFGDLKNE